MTTVLDAPAALTPLSPESFRLEIVLTLDSPQEQ